MRAAPLILMALASAARADGPLRAEDLFRSAPLGEARISPDGRHLGAIISDQDDHKNLVFFDLASFKPTGLRSSGEFEISSFEWLNDRRVVFSVVKDKISSWGLYGGDIDHMESFTPLDQFDVLSIIGIPASRPGHVLAWIRQEAKYDGRPGGLVEMNADRYLTSFEEARDHSAVLRYYSPPKFGTVVGWGANQQGELAICTTWFRGKHYLFHFLPGTGEWKSVEIPPLVWWMAVDVNDRFVWVVTQDDKEGSQLRTLDMDSGALGRPVLTDRDYDISAGRLFFSRVSHALAGVVYMRRSPVSVWFSRDFQAAQDVLNSHRPGTDNVLVGFDRAERKFLFALTGPEHPSSFELLDFDTSKLNILQDAAVWLKGGALRPVQSVAFTARDGLRLEGYLALPAGASRGHPVPLVVLVHGGPWARDTSEFNPEVQFLASRGYAVLQPNYRGSRGYSRRVSIDSNFDYRRMGDDVTDATRDILSTGLVDPARVAIMGASFGGYLAICGVTFESGLYRCAITECGVFDWDKFVKSKQDVARPGEYEILTDELGEPGRDDKALERISPLEHADRITVPVLIAHGTDDNIVDVAQSRRLASALRRRGIPCETFYRPNEAHGFSDYRDRVDFYHTVEAFLARYLGGESLVPPK